MEPTQLIDKAEQLLKSLASSVTRRDDKGMMDVSLDAGSLLKAVQVLEDAHWGYLAAITGLDHPAPKPPEGEGQAAATIDGSVEAVYHFCAGPVVLNLRVTLPYADPKVPSVCGIIPSATLYERELMELFGIECVGTPSPDHLVLPEDWPDGVYPLRKAFTGLPAPQA